MLNVESGYKPIFANKTNARVRLVAQGARATFGGVGTAFNPDDAVPFDQVLSLLAGGGFGDMMAAVYDPTGQATDIFDIDNILTGGNIATQMMVFDSGGGQQAQLSDGQLLVGSPGGTASMDATGTIYSTNNGDGGPELRTEIQFDTITVTEAGVDLVQITSQFSRFLDTTGQTIIELNPGNASISAIDLFNGTRIDITPNAINDSALGGGIDFSATVGTILFPHITVAGKLAVEDVTYPSGFFLIDPASQIFFIGDFNGDANGTYISADDAAGAITFSASSTPIAKITSSGLAVDTITELTLNAGTRMGKTGIMVGPVADAYLNVRAADASTSSMRMTHGTAPSAPVDGDIWREDNTNTGLKIRINGVTKTITVS